MRKRNTKATITGIGENKLLLSVEEVAVALSIGRTLVYDLLRRHELLSIKVGRSRRIPVKSVQDFLNRLSA
jgi:excisionase family DNA binding protein